jgi:UDP-N-acetyl-2-amino-2-deoxyglucuronate dehydrogenase
MVIVGTPSGLHGEHGTAAARRGLHVLVEKPIEITTVRCDALIEETRRSGVTLGVVFQDRMKAAVRELKATIAAGALGRVVLARAEVPWWRPPEYYRESRWRGTRELDGGGALINQAIHTVDLLMWLCGPVARVFGRTATQFHDIEVEDTAVAVLEFASGALGTLGAATCAYPGKARRVEISGSSGTAILEGDDLVTGAQSNRGQAPENAASPVVADVAPHRDLFIDFMRACATRTAPCCDGSDGRRSLAVVEAIYRSSRLRAPVQVDTGAAS